MSKIELDLKEDFGIVEDGAHYELPVYEVVDGKGLERIPSIGHTIKFVRGSKKGDEDVEKKEGTLHEHLISMMIHDLKLKNDLVPSHETSQVILKLEEALNWQRARSIDRVKRQVQETYKK
jgi:hypothetical protein